MAAEGVEYGLVGGAGSWWFMMSVRWEDVAICKARYVSLHYQYIRGLLPMQTFIVEALPVSTTYITRNVISWYR